MSTIDIGSGIPRYAAVVRAREPFVLFNVKADQNYVVRIRYLTKNKGTVASGASEVLNFTDNTEIPLLPEEYHHLVLLRAGVILTGELAPIKNRDGAFRYAGMQEAYAYFVGEYEKEFMRSLDRARRRPIARQRAAFVYAHAEFSTR